MSESFSNMSSDNLENFNTQDKNHSDTDFFLDPDLMDETILNYHWFYSDIIAEKIKWIPLSYKDSERLELLYKQNM